MQAWRITDSGDVTPMRSLVPSELKSPVVIIIAIVPLTGSLWGMWVVLRRSAGAHGVDNNPAAVTVDDDTTNLRASWVI